MRSTIQRIDKPAQPLKPQAAVKKQANGRRRAIGIHRAALDQLDAAVENRCDTESASADWQLRRPDVQDLFAHRTRRLLRQLEGELRQMRVELHGRAA